jgi:CDP-glucose 4,6-dehydratase
MSIRESFKGRKVFLTGHTGFKGSWMLAWLHDMGATVKGYALAPEPGNDLFHAIGGDSLCESVIADIRDADRLRAEILSFRPDVVFHMAAQPLVRLSYEIPAETFDVNTQGTANLLDALRHLEGPCTAVMITTDKVYENNELGIPFREEDRLGGHDPYSASKAAAEIVIDSYRKSFFSPDRYAAHQKSVSSARAGNVIGGGDMARDRIIPDIIRALSAGQPAGIRNPRSIRPWEHVLEPLHGYLVLAAMQLQDPVAFADAFNFGPHPENAFEVGRLAERMIEAWGSGSMQDLSGDTVMKEACTLQLDITKAMARLPWGPKLSFEDTVTFTVRWYRDRVVHGMSARELMMRDILDFESRH